MHRIGTLCPVSPSRSQRTLLTGQPSCAGAAKTASGEEVDFKDISLAEAFKILEVRCSALPHSATLVLEGGVSRLADRLLTSPELLRSPIAAASGHRPGMCEMILASRAVRRQSRQAV